MLSMIPDSHNGAGVIISKLIDKYSYLYELKIFFYNLIVGLGDISKKKYRYNLHKIPR